MDQAIDRTTEEQKGVFVDIWDRGNYRLGSPGLRIVPRFKEYIPEGCTINDYGSGTGRAAVALRRLGHPVNMVDIAPNALEDEAKNLLGPGFTFTLASLWDLPADFPWAPWGYCMEVLMTIPPAKLDLTLQNIRRTSDNVFVQVYNRIDRRVGHECNLIHEDRQWWQKKLGEYFDNVEEIPSQEIKQRYIYICREVGK